MRYPWTHVGAQLGKRLAHGGKGASAFSAHVLSARGVTLREAGEAGGGGGGWVVGGGGLA